VSVAITGALVHVAARHLELLKRQDVEMLARTVDDIGGVYFVPAFSGLTRHIGENARGSCRLTRYAN